MELPDLLTSTVCRLFGPRQAIYICYRTETDQNFAQRLYDRLVRRYGAAAVIDYQHDFPPGCDFPNEIAKLLARCKAVVTVIGPRWLALQDANGRRRLDSPADWVRIELQTALDREPPVAVIPLLVDSASMPGPHELPPELAPLARRHAIDIGYGHPRFGAGMALLTKRLDGLILPRFAGAALAAALLLLVAGFVVVGRTIRPAGAVATPTATASAAFPAALETPVPTPRPLLTLDRAEVVPGGGCELSLSGSYTDYSRACPIEGACKPIVLFRVPTDTQVYYYPMDFIEGPPGPVPFGSGSWSRTINAARRPEVAAPDAAQHCQDVPVFDPYAPFQVYLGLTDTGSGNKFSDCMPANLGYTSDSAHVKGLYLLEGGLEARCPRSAVPTSASASQAAGAAPALPVYVYCDGQDPGNHYSFWSGGVQGDGASVGWGGSVDYEWADGCHAGTSCMRIPYTPSHPERYWVQITWQEPQGSNGYIPGSPDLRGATRLSFWAKGERGGEVAVFGMGGIGRDAGTCEALTTFPDSVCPDANTPPLRLHPEWRHYAIDLSQDDLSQVVGGFRVALSGGEPFTLYLDDIRYEAAEEEPPGPEPTPSAAVIDADVYCTAHGRGGVEEYAVALPQPVTGVLLQMSERALPEFGVSLREVQVDAPDGTHLARTAAADASSYQDSYGCQGCSPDLAIDGDPESRWSSDFSEPQCFSLALAHPSRVSRISLVWEQAYPKRYCIELDRAAAPASCSQ